jgi:CHAD domain-containing protein
MVIEKLKRYLGNTNDLEVHDTSNEQTNCQLDEIKVEHRRWYDTLQEAKNDVAYDNCYYCIGGSTR